MIITLPRRTSICQSVAEVLLTGVAPLEAVNHRFDLFYFFVKVIDISNYIFKPSLI